MFGFGVVEKSEVQIFSMHCDYESKTRARMRRNCYAIRTYPGFLKLSLRLVYNCCAFAVAVHGRGFVLVV
jgi:hypothetical protein